MFAHLNGLVAEKNEDTLVLDVHGIGFELNVSAATLAAAPPVGGTMKVYCLLNVREDAMELFGFYSREEKHMYERLRSVNGIGARTALSILSALSVRDLSVALVTGDATTLTRVPGIGKKIAQRLVLELRDKVEDSELTGSGVSPEVATKRIGPEAEAIEALQSLGYSAAEAARAVSRVAGQTEDPNQLILLALKNASNG